MKALVLGGAGMLGHKLLQTLIASDIECGCTLRQTKADPFIAKIDLFNQVEVVENVDVMDLSALRKVLEELKPEWILNCIGVIKQRDTAKAALPSITINSLLPHVLADAAEAWGGRVIHFSTDCVFSGKDGNYTEASQSDAYDLYGKSKFLGEVATENALTLRTSIIGRELSHFASLIEWFLGQEGKTTKGFKRALYSGLTTNEMAKTVVRIMQERPDMSGLWHLTSPTINKFDLLQLVKAEFKMNVEILPEEDFVMDRSMTSERFWAETGWTPPTWPQMIADMAADPTPYHLWQAPK